MVFFVERLTGIEPVSIPWQGIVLPLYDSRITIIIYNLFRKQNYGAGPQSRTGHACLFRSNLDYIILRSGGRALMREYCWDSLASLYTFFAT